MKFSTPKKTETSGIVIENESSYQFIKYLIALLIGFALGILAYPQVSSLLPKDLKTQIEEVTGTKSNVNNIAIKGSFLEGTKYEMVIRFINRADSLGGQPTEPDTSLFIYLTDVLNTISKKLEYSKYGDKFEISSQEYITEALKTKGIVVISITYNITE